jgi:hypothetical protein
MAVTRLEIKSRQPFDGGKSFGDVGPYEQLDGIVHFSVDPGHPANATITDLSLAPRDADGRVDFSSDFRLLAPAEPGKGNRRILFDILNRGRGPVLRNINNAPDLAANQPPEAGNGFLMRQGYSLVWCGWQHDVPSVPGLLRCNVPNAVNADGSPVSGRIVISFQPIADTDAQFLSDRDHQAYPTNHLESWDSVLTVQEYEDGPETVIPREQWAFARFRDGRRVPDASHIVVDGGFKAGKVYRVLYETSHAPVVGLGILATRDIVAWLRHGDTDTAGSPNPLSGAIGRAYAYGRSQSGRFLRQMLHLGINVDESGRIVFDGMLPNVAGGKMGEFNVRFGQPSSLSNRSVNNLPPFLDVEPDGSDGILSGLIERGLAPKVIYTNTSSEYWGGHGALAHVSADGSRDVEPPDLVRSWLFCGTQHGPANLPVSDTNPDTGARGTQPLNYVDYRPLMRAALLHLDNWVTHDQEPPANRYPNHADSTITETAKLADAFRAMPGVVFPTYLKTMRQLDFGPDRAVPTQMPPVVGDAYPSLVSAVDADGNEIGGVRLPSVSVPLATYAGWNVRHADIGGAGQVLAPGGTVVGCAIPFSVTRAERLAANDPRASIEERYASRDEYLARVQDAADQLVAEGYLLAEDVATVVGHGADQYDAIVGSTAAVAADN